ncbi:hypothetical protein [Cronobacter sakazakii]|uniref:hypothetical protein n=1 Tax=Cronobacter sakazakii TaxID=28141 RepID=UPI000975D8A0|nr:hypothetical protein [Cronobacter sakazakii]
MKLIDLLVQELPKRGGWPLDKKHHAFISQDSNGEVWAFPSKPNLNIIKGKWNISNGDGSYVGLITTIADDFTTSTVTREQYEAALAAAQQPVWNGEGLPPVGTICEYQTSSNGNLPVRIECVTQDGVAFTWLGGHDQYKGLDCVSAFYAAKYFKPIRSEADTKRASVVTALAKAGGDFHFEYGRKTIDGELSSPGWYKLYDIIAAGEIAGIRIE